MAEDEIGHRGNFEIDLFSERIEEHIEEAQQERGSVDNGEDSFRPYLRKRVVLSDRSAHMLSLDELRYFPKFLCDVTLRTPDAEINEDHFQYWAWTGCMMAIHNHIQTVGDDYSSFVMTSFDSDILRDMSTLLQLGLIMKREESVIALGADMPTYLTRRYNPSYGAIFTDSFRIVTRMATSILEGLLRRRCKALNDDGTLADSFQNILDLEEMEERGQEVGEGLREVVEEKERIASYVNGNTAYLWEALPMWHNEYTEPATREALNGISTFSDEVKENMESLLGDYMETIMDNLEQYDSEDNFFAFLNQVRNPVAHNQQIYHSLGSIFVNLCCMVYWDQFPDAFYEDHRDTFFEAAAETEGWSLAPGFRPIDFYPLGGQ